MFPLKQFMSQIGELKGTIGNFIELFDMGAMGSFDAAVEFRGARRQNKQPYAELLALRLKNSLEFRAAVQPE